MKYRDRIKANPELYAKYLAYNRERAAKRRAANPEKDREILRKSRAKKKAEVEISAFQKFVDNYERRCRAEGIEPTLTVADLKRIFDADRDPLRESGKRMAERNRANGKTFGGANSSKTSNSSI